MELEKYPGKLNHYSLMKLIRSNIGCAFPDMYAQFENLKVELSRREQNGGYLLEPEVSRSRKGVAFSGTLASIGTESERNAGQAVACDWMNYFFVIQLSLIPPNPGHFLKFLSDIFCNDEKFF